MFKNKWFITIVSILAIYFYIQFLIQNFSLIPSLNYDADAFLVLGFSSLIFVLTIGLSGEIWFMLLKKRDILVSRNQVLAIFAIANFGKYIPGNFWQYLGLAFLAQEIGIPKTVTAKTILIKLIWVVEVGAGLTLISLIFFFDIQTLGFKIGSVHLGMIIIFLMCLPWLSIKFLNRVFSRLPKRLYSGGKIYVPPLKTSLIISVYILMNFIIMGLILKTQAVFFFNITEGSIFELTFLFAAAWTAGFLLPGFSAGLGVREAIMVVLLSPVLGAGAAAGVSLSMRMTSILSDAISFVLGTLWRKCIK